MRSGRRTVEAEGSGQVVQGRSGILENQPIMAIQRVELRATSDHLPQHTH